MTGLAADLLTQQPEKLRKGACVNFGTRLCFSARHGPAVRADPNKDVFPCSGLQAQEEVDRVLGDRSKPNMGERSAHSTGHTARHAQHTQHGAAGCSCSCTAGAPVHCAQGRADDSPCCCVHCRPRFDLPFTCQQLTDSLMHCSARWQARPAACAPTALHCREGHEPRTVTSRT